MNNPKGIAYAALSSSTFGLAPLFTVTLLRDGFSPFKVLTYRWGVASVALLLFGLATGRRLRIARRDFGVVFLLSLFRAGCSLSLVFAYANIATGVASTIHFLYPLAVALFAAAGSLTSGLHWVDDSRTWGNILGLAIPATAVSNIALVKAIKAIGPTLTSILGAMEPLTAVLIGVLHFGEPFTAAGIAGVVLSVAAVTIVVTQGGKPAGNV